MGRWRLVFLGVVLTGLIACPSLLGAPGTGLPASERATFDVMRRVGRPMFAPVVFNVRATITNDASGQAERCGPTGVCMSTIEAVGDEELCGQHPGRENESLSYVNRKLSLGLRGDPLPPLPSPRLCGVNGIETASGPPPDGFHAPVDLRPRPLAPSRIFGAVRRFKAELESPDAVSREDSPIPGLSGAAVTRGFHQAVVRFIRVTP